MLIQESSVHAEFKGIHIIKNVELQTVTGEIAPPPRARLRSPSMENVSVHQGRSKKPIFVYHLDPRTQRTIVGGSRGAVESFPLEMYWHPLKVDDSSFFMHFFSPAGVPSPSPS